MITAQATTLMMLSLLVTSAAPAEERPYSAYEVTTKKLTEMEWRLLKANVALAHLKARVSFDAAKRVFRIEYWKTTFDVKRLETDLIRDDFLSVVELAASTLVLNFPEFSERREQDLRASLILGRDSGQIIAEYDGRTVRFRDAYYEFLKEVGRR